MIILGNTKKLEKSHLQKFGIEPYVIGLFWSDAEEFEKQLEDSLSSGKPYNEYEMLTKSEQQDYDEGNLVF